LVCIVVVTVAIVFFFKKFKNLDKFKKIYERQSSQNKIVPVATAAENTQSLTNKIEKNSNSDLPVKETVYYEPDMNEIINEYNK
jgi:hypothetical protein